MSNKTDRTKTNENAFASLLAIRLSAHLHYGFEAVQHAVLFSHEPHPASPMGPTGNDGVATASEGG